MARRAPAAPKIATGRGVNGEIVTRAKFPEGTKLLLEEHVVREDLELELDEQDKRAIDRALASVRAGKGISLQEFRRKMRRM